eukprot:scaffold2120_cov259-Pinguiococcus_pyrenoidosus.AAC.10
MSELRSRYAAEQTVASTRTGEADTLLAGETQDALSAAERKRRESVRIWSVRVQSLFWVLLMGVAVVHTNFVYVLLEDRSVNRLFLNIGVVGATVNCAMFVYLMYVEPLLTKQRPLLDPTSPKMLLSTILSLGSFFWCVLSFCKGLWPVYGLLTPFILAVVLMGLFMGSNLVPFLFDFYADK